MATMELKKTNTGNSEEERDTNTRQRLDTASTNRRLVPLTKGDINIIVSTCDVTPPQQ